MTGDEILRESGSIIMAIDAPEGMDADELDTRLAAWLEAQEDKLAAYRWVCARIDSEVALLKGITDRVQGRARTLDRNKERIRSMATAMLLDREILIKEQLKTGKVKGCQIVVSRTVRFR